MLRRLHCLARSSPLALAAAAAAATPTNQRAAIGFADAAAPTAAGAAQSSPQGGGVGKGEQENHRGTRQTARRVRSVTPLRSAIPELAMRTHLPMTELLFPSTDATGTNGWALQMTSEGPQRRRHAAVLMFFPQLGPLIEDPRADPRPQYDAERRVLFFLNQRDVASVLAMLEGRGAAQEIALRTFNSSMTLSAHAGDAGASPLHASSPAQGATQLTVSGTKRKEGAAEVAVSVSLQGDQLVRVRAFLEFALLHSMGFGSMNRSRVISSSVEQRPGGSSGRRAGGRDSSRGDGTSRRPAEQSSRRQKGKQGNGARKRAPAE